MTKRITSGKYNPSVHAVERIRQYFGIMEDGAKSFVNEAMRKAKYVTTQRDGNLVYKYEDKDAMIVVDDKTNVVITILPPNGKGKHNKTDSLKLSQDNVFISAFQATIKRELTKARRIYIRETRSLAEEIAVLGVDIAQLTLNKARARSPITQGHIQRKIDELHAEAVRKDDEKVELEAQFRAMKSEVGGLVDV